MSSRVQQSQPVQGVTTVGAALSGATVGVKLSYVVPAGRQAELTWASAQNFTGAPTVAIQAIVGGTTVTLGSAAGPESFSGLIALNAGDTVQLNVTALVAASVFDGVISAREFVAV